MKTVATIILLLSLVSCGKGGGGGDPVGPSAGFNAVLMDAGNNVITSADFVTVLNPTYDAQIEMDLTIKNIGTEAGDIAYFSDSVNFEVTTLDNKCNGTDLLQPGESCAIKVIFKHIGSPDGPYTANLNGFSDGDTYKPYTASGTITTSI